MNETILKKIHKLLKLADCETGNVNETAAAAAKASQLMAEYKISRADLLSVEEMIDEDPIISQPVDSSGRVSTWKVQVLISLCEMQTCIVILSTRKYKGRPPKGVKRSETFYVVYGQQSDVEAVTYLYHLYLKKVNELCNKWAEEMEASRRERNSFRLGASETICLRLKAAKKDILNTTANPYALVKVDTVKRKIQEHLPQDPSEQWKAKPDPDRWAYMEGQRAGSYVELSNPNNKKLEAKKQQLPSRF